MTNNRLGKPGLSAFGVPGMPGAQPPSGAAKAVQDLIMARERDGRMNLIQCKCGSRVLIKRDLVEVAIFKYPKMLGLPKEQFPEKIIKHRDLATVYFCAKCGKQVCTQKTGVLTPLDEKDAKENVVGGGDSDEHSAGGKEV